MSHLQAVIDVVAETDAKKEEWSFLEAFELLKKTGVLEYTVDIASYETVYKGNFGVWKKPAPKDFSPLEINEHADKEVFLKALERRMKKETTYPGFLSDIAASGIAYYAINMETRTATYYDVHSESVHVQQIPVVS